MQNRKTAKKAVFFAAASALFALVFAAPARVGAQDRSGDPRAGGLSSGEYLLISGGMTVPVNAQGTLRSYKAGPVIGLGYENWQSNGSGIGAVGLGVSATYSALPAKAGFAEAVAVTTGGQAAGASAKSAKILEIVSTIRIRIPSPVVMPAVTLGLGFINWSPGGVSYLTTSGERAKVRYQRRSGAELTLGGSIDRHVYDRYGIFAEADYVYGFTTFGQAFTQPNGTCVASACDPQKNTSVATLRGGLRVGVGR